MGPRQNTTNTICKALHISPIYALLTGYRRPEMSETRYYPGLHKLWYPGIRDRSTWGKFGAHGEHGDVFLFSNLGAL